MKLGDVGVARATEGTEQTKTMMGSYRYVAPEVGMALRCHYSKRADVYSFGESSVILDGMEILKLLLFGSEILESCHSSRLSWISKIQYQIKSGSKHFDKGQLFTVGR